MKKKNKTPRRKQKKIWMTFVMAMTFRYTTKGTIREKNKYFIKIKNFWQIKIIMRCHLTAVRMTIINVKRHNKCWQGCGNTGEFLSTVLGNIN